MGLFDFFRGKKAENVSIKNVKLKELEVVIQEKKKELSIKEKEILNQVKDHTKLLIKDLEEKSANLENIDLSQKKAPEKVKLVVKENLFYFTSNLKKLTSIINDIKVDELNKFVEELNKRFLEFEKRSVINYEKATFLIGKELGDVKESISIFFKNLNQTLSENKELFDHLKLTRNIEAKLAELKAFYERKKEIENNIKNIESEVENLKNENESFEKIIEKTKKTDSYKAEIDKEIIIHEKNQQYERELLRLKEMIDFKLMANFFHSNEKMMNKLKCYKDNFKETFEADSNSLINLAKEAGIESDKLRQMQDKISRLTKEQENILNLKQNQKEDEIKKVLNLQSDIKDNLSEIEGLNNNNAKELKIMQKVDDTNKEFIEVLKKDLIKININLIDGE
ncbi:MAG: hypothetical protein PHF67_04735 [Candidatus Nanoarchaeia archaeon]|nr:hypothetical protein [Candidatus Nanoarchaeia archaeon]